VSRVATNCRRSISSQVNAANLGANIASGTTAPNTSSRPSSDLVKNRAGDDAEDAVVDEPELAEDHIAQHVGPEGGKQVA
jgi:hypothetical protein